MTEPTPGATIAGLNHDLVNKRSTVILVWDGDPDRRLFLPVKFGCSFDGLPAEAERALRALSSETATLKLNPAP